MRAFDDKHPTEFVIVMRVFQAVVGIGLFFSLMMLAKNLSPEALTRHLVYVSWFTVTLVSIEAILQWIKIGVYALVLMTIAITILDFLTGAATLGGASLGLLVVFIMLVYVRPVWHQFN